MTRDQRIAAFLQAVDRAVDACESGDTRSEIAWLQDALVHAIMLLAGSRHGTCPDVIARLAAEIADF